jgi:hypothetical protein
MLPRRLKTRRNLRPRLAFTRTICTRAPYSVDSWKKGSACFIHDFCLNECLIDIVKVCACTDLLSDRWFVVGIMNQLVTTTLLRSFLIAA